MLFYFGGLSVIVERRYSLSLHKKINQFTSILEKNIQNGEKPKEFRKIIPIREGIQFPVNAEIPAVDDMPLFRVTAV